MTSEDHGSVGNTVPNTQSAVVGNSVPNMTYAKAASLARPQQSRSVSRGRRGGKRNGQAENQGSSKRPRQNHPYKIEIWQRKEGKKAPISLYAWRQMDTLLCISAAEKVRKEGPPTGGIGLKNWTQHTHPGSDKASQLSSEDRFGHAIIRFSSLNAQEWYRPLVEAALGTDQDGEMMQLSLDAESDDSRARYTGSVLYREFTTFGENEEERCALLLRIILAAIDEPYAADEQKSEVFGGRLLRSEDKENLWSLTFKFPPVVETALDNILLGEKYGILPTAICPVRFLKQRKSETPEQKLIEATNRMKVQSTVVPGRGKSTRSSDGETPQPHSKATPVMDTP